MAVIPLIDDKTVVDSKAAFDAVGGLRGDVFLIQDIESEQLIAPNEANVTYDLRVGPEYRYLHNLQKHELSEEGQIVLQKKEKR